MEKMLDIGSVFPNPNQPRKKFDKEKLQELALSIKEVGLIESIKVKPIEDGKFQIISGERRWRASKLIGEEKISAVIKDVEEERIVIESLVANQCGEKLSDIEQRNAYKKIMIKKDINNLHALSKVVGKPYNSIVNMFDFVEIQEEMKNRLGTAIAEKIPKTTILETKGFEKDERIKIIELIVEWDLSSTKTKNLVNAIKKSPESVKRAIVEGKIDYIDITPLLKTKIPDKLENSLIEELSKRKKTRETDREIDIDLDRRILKGELGAKKIKFVRSRDEQLRDEIRQIRDNFVYRPPTIIKIIEDENIKDEMLELINDIVITGGKMLDLAKKPSFHEKEFEKVKG